MRCLKFSIIIFFLVSIIVLFTSSTIVNKEKGLTDFPNNGFIQDIKINEKEKTSFLKNTVDSFNNTVHSFRTREGQFSILTSLGKFAPIAFFPEFAFRTPSPLTIDVGIGAGYRDFTSRNVDKTIKDNYIYWFVGGSFGVSYRDIVPNLSIGISHISRIQKIDSINKGDPLSDNVQFPFYIGYFDLLISYSKMGKYLYSKEGISASFLLSFYLNGFLSLKLTFDFATSPFVEIKNSSDEVMFAINYMNHERVLYYYNFKKDISNIPDVIRRDYMLGMRGVGGQTDRPISFVSENTLMLQGPIIWRFRPFFKAFVDFGFTYGPHYQNRENIEIEYLISPGFDLGINLLDFISVAFRATFPLPYYLSGNDKSFYHLEAVVQL